MSGVFNCDDLLLNYQQNEINIKQIWNFAFAGGGGGGGGGVAGNDKTKVKFEKLCK